MQLWCFTYYLKECHVPGTRMWRRGANLEGDTANFIETEQIIEAEDFKSSLLQVLVNPRVLLFNSLFVC